MLSQSFCVFSLSPSLSVVLSHLPTCTHFYPLSLSLCLPPTPSVFLLLALCHSTNLSLSLTHTHTQLCSFALSKEEPDGSTGEYMMTLFLTVTLAMAACRNCAGHMVWCSLAELNDLFKQRTIKFNTWESYPK